MNLFIDIEQCLQIKFVRIKKAHGKLKGRLNNND